MMYFSVSSSLPSRTALMQHSISPIGETPEPMPDDLSERIQHLGLKIPKISASSSSLVEMNKEYRTHFYPAAELPEMIQSVVNLPPQVVSLITSYYTNSIYAAAPELIDPELPLESSLEFESTSPCNEKNTPRIKMLKPPPTSGYNGDVVFIRLKQDPYESRWIAVKQPCLQDCEDPIALSKFRLQSYHNNLYISSKINGHPNFMNILGIVLKQGAQDDFTPYLLLGYIEGEELEYLTRKKLLSFQDLQSIVAQFINALTFLLKIGVKPEDMNFGNLLITSKKQLKFIDFDYWSTVPASSQLLAKELFDLAQRFIRELIFQSIISGIIHDPAKSMGDKIYYMPPLKLDDDDISGSFEKSLQKLLSWFNKLIT